MYKLAEKFANLSPKQKAFAEIAGTVLASIIGSGIVVLVAHLGYWFEFAMALICYGMFGLIKMLYESRVFHYELQNKLNKKG
jgi:hypothetical protein